MDGIECVGNAGNGDAIEWQLDWNDDSICVRCKRCDDPRGSAPDGFRQTTRRNLQDSRRQARPPDDSCCQRVAVSITKKCVQTQRIGDGAQCVLPHEQTCRLLLHHDRHTRGKCRRLQ